MSMSRADAASYLAASLAELLTDAGLDNLDESGDLAEPIDDALLLTGTAYGDLATATVADADALGFRKVLRWTALARIREAVAHRVDVTLDGPNMSKRRSQIVGHLDRLTADAKAAADPYVTVTADGGAWSLATISTDWIEPDTEAVA